MAEVFEVDIDYNQLKRPEDKEPTTFNIRKITLTRNGVPIADFSDKIAALRCADLLNKHGVY